IRKKLRKHGIQEGAKVAFSTELPKTESLLYTDGSNFKKSAYATMSYLPSAFGGAIASAAIREIIRSEPGVSAKTLPLWTGSTFKHPKSNIRTAATVFSESVPRSILQTKHMILLFESWKTFVNLDYSFSTINCFYKNATYGE